jgi:hypothetical protein
MTMQADLVREFSGRAPALAGFSAAVVGDPQPAGRRVGRWLAWGAATAACLALALTAGLGDWAGRDRADAPARTTGPPPAGQSPGGTATGGERLLAKGKTPVAVVGKLVDARWEPTEGAPPAEGSPLPEGRLRLRSGSATLVFVNGVVLTLEGPADVDLISVDRVFSRRGKLRALVPKGAEGFVIATPGSAVVDLGTEFALNVEPDGRTRVMVFEGEVEAALLTDSGDPRRSRLVEKSKACDLDPRSGRISESPARPGGFASAYPLEEGDLDLAPAYATEVLKSAPRGYWRFEGLAGGEIPNQVAGGPRLRIHGPVELARSPSGNGYAVFKAGAPEQFLDTEGLWKLPSWPGHAVEFWLQATSFSHASLVGFYPPRSSNPPDQLDWYLHAFLVEIRSWERISLHKPASIRFLHRWPIDKHVNDSLFSESIYLPRRWHHIVAQKYGGEVDLFFDGVLERTNRLDSDHPTLGCHLVVGRRNPDTRDMHDLRPFVGRLDELALYDHPLTVEEVRRHFRLGTKSLSRD